MPTPDQIEAVARKLHDEDNRMHRIHKSVTWDVRPQRIKDIYLRRARIACETCEVTRPAVPEWVNFVNSEWSHQGGFTVEVTWGWDASGPEVFCKTASGSGETHDEAFQAALAAALAPEAGQEGNDG